MAPVEVGENMQYSNENYYDSKILSTNGQPKPKKPLSKARQASNRLAQKNFRERRKVKMSALELQVSELSADIERCQIEQQQIQQQTQLLQQLYQIKSDKLNKILIADSVNVSSAFDSQRLLTLLESPEVGLQDVGLEFSVDDLKQLGQDQIGAFYKERVERILALLLDFDSNVGPVKQKALQEIEQIASQLAKFMGLLAYAQPHIVNKIQRISQAGTPYEPTANDYEQMYQIMKYMQLDDSQMTHVLAQHDAVMQAREDNARERMQLNQIILKEYNAIAAKAVKEQQSSTPHAQNNLNPEVAEAIAAIDNQEPIAVVEATRKLYANIEASHYLVAEQHIRVKAQILTRLQYAQLVGRSWPRRPDLLVLAACIRWHKQQEPSQVPKDEDGGKVRTGTVLASAMTPQERGSAIMKVASACVDHDLMLEDEDQGDMGLPKNVPQELKKLRASMEGFGKRLRASVEGNRKSMDMFRQSMEGVRRSMEYFGMMDWNKGGGGSNNDLLALSRMSIDENNVEQLFPTGLHGSLSIEPLTCLMEGDEGEEGNGEQPKTPPADPLPQSGVMKAQMSSLFRTCTKVSNSGTSGDGAGASGGAAGAVDNEVDSNGLNRDMQSMWLGPDNMVKVAGVDTCPQGMAVPPQPGVIQGGPFGANMPMCPPCMPVPPGMPGMIPPGMVPPVVPGQPLPAIPTPSAMGTLPTPEQHQQYMQYQQSMQYYQYYYSYYQQYQQQYLWYQQQYQQQYPYPMTPAPPGSAPLANLPFTSAPLAGEAAANLEPASSTVKDGSSGQSADGAQVVSRRRQSVRLASQGDGEGE